MHDYLFSIIIPHKNIPKLLKRCIDSIPRRDDLEVIVVDDDSDEAIVDFDNFPGAERDDVNIFFDKSSKGPGFARNIGIKMAKGRWIIFIDADDFFNYCIEDVLEEYKDDASDVVYFAASSVDSETYQNSSRADDFVTLIDHYFKDKVSGELSLRYVVASPCGKLIKRSLLIDNNIFFPDTLICEDVEFSYMLGFYAKQIKADKRALCCYTSRTISRSSVLSKDLLLDKIRVQAKRDKFLTDNNIPLPLGSIYIEALMDLKRQKKKEMYKEVIDILQEYGISEEQINATIKSKEELQKEKTVIEKTFDSIRCQLAIRTRIKRLFHVRKF